MDSSLIGKPENLDLELSERVARELAAVCAQAGKLYSVMTAPSSFRASNEPVRDSVLTGVYEIRQTCESSIFQQAAEVLKDTINHEVLLRLTLTVCACDMYISAERYARKANEIDSGNHFATTSEMYGITGTLDFAERALAESLERLTDIAPEELFAKSCSKLVYLNRESQ